jgi:hypothetical protein
MPRAESLGMSNILYLAPVAVQPRDLERNAELDELLAELAEIAATAGDLPLLAADRPDFGTDWDDELTSPFIAIPLAAAS